MSINSLAKTNNNIDIGLNEEEEEQNFSYAMQLVTSASLPMVLLAAIQLDVMEIIARAGPGEQLSPSEIAAHVSPRNPDAAGMLDRMLRLLASYSVLTRSVAKSMINGHMDGDKSNDKSNKTGVVYGLAPVAKYFLRNNTGGGSLGSLLALMHDKVIVDSWYQLEDAVCEGGVPFDRAHGMHPYPHMGIDHRFSEVFNKAMADHSTVTINRILERYKGFENLKTLVDVGGGLGVNLSVITTRYPTLKGINFDLPHVVQHAPAYPGVEHVGGDMFESVPHGDAIFLKWILHNWDDGQCVKLLKNCYKALSENGKVVAVDYILPLVPDTSASVKTTCQADLIMMTQTSKGKERSEPDFLALATAAGFRGIRVDCSVCNLWVMEFYK